jgi:hypothetical protein
MPNGAKKLYDYFKSLVSKVLNDTIRTRIFENDGEMLIRTYNKLWQRIVLIVYYVKKIFSM